MSPTSTSSGLHSPKWVEAGRIRYFLDCRRSSQKGHVARARSGTSRALIAGLRHDSFQLSEWSESLVSVVLVRSLMEFPEPFEEFRIPSYIAIDHLQTELDRLRGLGFAFPDIRIESSVTSVVFRKQFPSPFDWFHRAFHIAAIQATSRNAAASKVRPCVRRKIDSCAYMNTATVSPKPSEVSKTTYFDIVE